MVIKIRMKILQKEDKGGERERVPVSERGRKEEKERTQVSVQID